METVEIRKRDSNMFQEWELGSECLGLTDRRDGES
jgi:hypothetical protein